MTAEGLLPEGAKGGFAREQWITLGVIAALLLAVIVLQIDIVVGATAGVAVLLLARVSDEEAAVRAVPWGTILMISGDVAPRRTLRRSYGNAYARMRSVAARRECGLPSSRRFTPH